MGMWAFQPPRPAGAAQVETAFSALVMLSNFGTALQKEPGVSRRQRTKMTTKPVFISDAQLEHRASKQGRSSAEAYVLLELREARCAGDDVSAFVVNGHYTVKSTPNLLTVPPPSDSSISPPNASNNRVFTSRNRSPVLRRLRWQSGILKDMIAKMEQLRLRRAQLS